MARTSRTRRSCGWPSVLAIRWGSSLEQLSSPPCDLPTWFEFHRSWKLDSMRERIKNGSCRFLISPFKVHFKKLQVYLILSIATSHRPAPIKDMECNKSGLTLIYHSLPSGHKILTFLHKYKVTNTLFQDHQKSYPIVARPSSLKYKILVWGHLADSAGRTCNS